MAGERLKAMIAQTSPSAPLSPVEKLRIAFELHESGVALMRQNLRRKHPEASEADIRESLVAWLRRERG